MTVAGGTIGAGARLGGRALALVWGGAGRRRRLAVAALLVVAALCVRVLFFKYQTGDYTSYFHTWYVFIKQHGGFGALKYNFANYNEPYLYLLALLTYLPIGALTGIKLISVAFDLVLAYFSYRVVRLRYPRGWVPMIAAAIILFLPTVVLNSSLWGQIDATYTSLGVGALYFVLRRRPWLACLFFGLALAFKLQTVFLLPVLLLLVLRRWVPWRALLMVPLVFVLADIPAFAVGASLSTLWSAYTGEIGLYQELTLNAPNFYQFLGITESSVIRDAGIAFTLVLVLGLIAIVVARRTELTPARVVLASAVSVVLVPFFLPAMHERYFYLADALTVIAAFYAPRRLLALPFLEQFASLFAYMPFLLATTTTGTTGGPSSPGPGGNGAAPGGAAFTGPRGGGLAGAVGPRGAPGAGAPGAGARGALPSGSRLAGGGAAVPGHALVSFDILSSAMLVALVLVVWAAVREFGDPHPAGPVEPAAGDVTEAGLAPLG